MQSLLLSNWPRYVAAISSHFAKTYDCPDQRNGRWASQSEKLEKEVSAGVRSARLALLGALLVRPERFEKFGVAHRAKSKCA